MSRNGSGVYTSPASSWSPAVNGALASYTDWNSLLADISAALTQSLSADGQTPVSGNLNMNGNKLTNLAAGTGTGQSLRWEQLFSQGTELTIASADTVDIGAQNTSFLNVTGTTAITSFGTNYNGPRFLRFSGALTLTNSSTLILPGNANITTAAGDTCIVIPKATSGTADGWVVVAYQTNTTPQANAMGFKNRLINAQGLINQRAVSGTVTLTAGSYGHDRFKAGASGCTYTFSTSNNVTTFTITSGSLMQVIEGLNLESGNYVLSWSGTAQGRVGSGTYGASGAITATVVGGTNTTVEFNTGTLSLPQFEKGSTATSFDYRPYGTELSLCQRYYERIVVGVGGGYASGAVNITNQARVMLPFSTPKRATPSMNNSPPSTFSVQVNGGSTVPSSFSYSGTNSVVSTYIFAIGTFTLNHPCVLIDSGSSNSYIEANSEL